MVGVEGGEDHRAAVARALLFPVAATVVVYGPQLVTNAGQWDDVVPVVAIGWLIVLLLAAPVVAFLMNRRRPFATDASRALQSALPQLPLAVGLVLLDVWLEVRTGYLLAGSGEEAMSYGIGGVLSGAVGLLLTMLVAVGARLGAHRSSSRRG